MGRIKKHNEQRHAAASQPLEREILVDVHADDVDSTTSEPIVLRSKSAAKRRRKKPTSSVERVFSSSVRYSFDVLSKIMSLLKWPLAVLLTAALARFLLMKSLSRVTGAIQYQVRTSVCSLPFAAPLLENAAPGFCETSKVKLDFNDLLDIQKNTVNAAAVSTYTGNLPLQLKKAEIATHDLRAVLQVSDLTCKNSLDEALQSFSVHARDSSRAIQKTVVRVGGLLDASLAMNEWALNALQRVEGKSSGIGSLIPFVAQYDSRLSVTTTYVQAMDELSQYLGRLIESNELAYQKLDSLEEDLHLIHEIIGLEKRFQKTEKDEVLSSLWSFLGGNRKLKKIFSTNLATLDGFERSRAANKEVVAATSVAFTKMMLQIEDFRTRVQRPGITGDGIPIEMHIRSIELGIEELRSTRAAHRQLDQEETDLLLD